MNKGKDVIVFPLICNEELKTKDMLIFVIGVIVGAVLDNMFAPKIKMEDGKITLEYSKKKKTTP